MARSKTFLELMNELEAFANGENDTFDPYEWFDEILPHLQKEKKRRTARADEKHKKGVETTTKIRAYVKEQLIARGAATHPTLTQIRTNAVNDLDVSIRTVINATPKTWCRRYSRAVQSQ